jgi:hypothetical protein
MTDYSKARVVNLEEVLKRRRAEKKARRTAAAKSKPRSRRVRETETFARVLHDRALELYRHRINGAAWVVLIELDRMILAQRGKNPVLFWSPRLQDLKLIDHTRERALRQLEAAGVVKIERRGKGLAPQVTHLWHPLRE